MYKTFITIISNKFDSHEFTQVINFLADKGFASETEFQTSDWIAPDEYVQEMGQNLETKILVFKKRFNESDIVLLKQYSEELEKKYSIGGGRFFNINPGFLSEQGMFLLSHKPNDVRGRIPFGNYYSEKQYDKKDALFIARENTFSEYLGDRIKEFNKIS